jgi:hypothetical protein
VNVTAPASISAPPERRPRIPLTRGVVAKVRAAGSAVRLVASPWVRPAPLPAVAYPKVFVVGCPRSGTTWVAEALAAHPRAFGGSESHAYPIVCGSLSGDDGVLPWARLIYAYDRGVILARPTGLHHYVDRTTLLRLSRSVRALHDADHAAGALIRGVFDSYYLASEHRDDAVLVEKTPQHILWAQRILHDFPEAHVVEVLRDGRDACVSMQMRATRVPVVPATRHAQIATWVTAVRTGIALRSDPTWRGRITLVRYEDMKADPVAAIARLYEETGLGGSADLARAGADATDISRYGTGAGHFRFRGEQGAWRDHFSDADLQLFREMVGDLFVDAGYSYGA